MGRFGLPIFAKLKGYVVAPEFSVFLGILFLAASVVLVIKIFDVSQVLVCSLLSILIMISPTVISTMTYQFCCDAYFFSYFLAVLAAYLLTAKKGILPTIGAIGTSSSLANSWTLIFAIHITSNF